MTDGALWPVGPVGATLPGRPAGDGLDEIRAALSHHTLSALSLIMGGSPALDMPTDDDDLGGSL